MAKFLLSIVGLYVGAVATSDWHGGLFGVLIGYLLGAHLQLKTVVDELQRELKTIRANLIDSSVTVEKADVQADVDSETTTPVGSQEPEEEIDSEVPTVLGAVRGQQDVPAEQAPVAVVQEAPSDSTGVERGPGIDIPDSSKPGAGKLPSLLDKAIGYIRHFFTTGNVVVKIGVIILFFGVGFLIRYAVERQVLPIELRLTGIGIGAIVMLLVGWRLRHRRSAYALVLQGGAIGIMYITIFATAKTFHLINPLAALLIMILLVTFSAVLAYAQDSRSLAIFGSAGGFIAPILTSTGSGSHVMLFSYYALLNTGIFAMAWVKAWRLLNWVGFAFTFVIGAAWGIKYYQPQYFASTEPFLILFFLFYLAIAVLYAHRQPPRLRGLVDGTLVFGVPLVAFTLQAGLVRDFEFGRALSALAMAAVYTGLAKLLWHRQVEGMRLLTESFLALGVIFASLAVPFALDGRWTAATWSLEGAAAVWLGIHQRRLLTRNFGLLLQVGASLMFLSTLQEPFGATPFVNSAYIGCLFTSLAGLFTSYTHYRHRRELQEWERGFHVFLLIWGVAWWLGAGMMEIDHHLSYRFELNAVLIFVTTSFLLLDIIARRLQWQPALLVSLLLLPVIILSALISYIDHADRHPFSNLGYLAWSVAFLGQFWILFRNQENWKPWLLSNSHTGTLWVLVFMLSWISAASVNHLVTGSNIWGDVSWGLVPAITCLLIMLHHDNIAWPIAKYRESYLGTGLAGLLIVASIWLLASCFIEGRPRPLIYIPIANPLELAQLFVIFVLLIWVVYSTKEKIPPLESLESGTILYFVAAMAFTWLNSIIGRAVHFFYGVRFNIEALFDSAVYQASISITWTLTALTITALATRHGKRKLWFVGAALIGIVAVKLFVVDLKDTGTIERIISFLTVGILLSVIGYLSPLPPREPVEENSGEEND